MESVNGADWMQDNITLLGDKKLSDICITGSHDSGMSVSEHGTAGGNACNTITQSNNIGKQLLLGARYFDIRPIIGSGQFYTGHYTKIEEFGISSMQGARGQSIAEIVEQVNEFTNQHKELIVLNLSHDMDTDAGNSNYPAFTQDQWNSLLQNLADNLDNLYISDQQNLLENTLSAFIGQGKAAVVVIVEPDSVDIGKFRSQGFYPYSAFNAYNKYSDTNDLATMAAKQFQYMKEQRQQGNYFLLSWTLTQSAGQALACLLPGATTILEMASEADSKLVEDVKAQVTPTLYPNIIYIDNITNTDFADLAMYINTMALS